MTSTLDKEKRLEKLVEPDDHKELFKPWKGLGTVEAIKIFWARRSQGMIRRKEFGGFIIQSWCLEGKRGRNES